MKVFLTGATGYVGQMMTAALLDAGHQVVALQRNQTHRSLHTDRVKIVEGDLTTLNPSTLAEFMKSCDAVIHLVGIIREYHRTGVTMERIHVQGTQNIVTAAKHAGIARLLYMSALGAREDAVTSYHRSKWEAEEYIRHSGLAYTIFQPSVIFGKGGPGPNFLKQLADMVERAPVVPIIGNGGFLLQPVSIQNVVQGFVNALDLSHTIHQQYEVGGPDCISYLQIMERIAAHFRKKIRTITVPVGFMKAVVPILQKLPNFPLTYDQLIMLIEQNVCKSDWRTYYNDLQLKPDSFQIIY